MKYIQHVTSLLITYLFLSSCTTSISPPLDYSKVSCAPIGEPIIGVLVDRGKNKLLMDRYEPHPSPIPLRGCRAKDSNYDFEAFVSLMRDNDGWRFCTYRKSNSNLALKPFKLFEVWSNYPLEQRERTKEALNMELMQFNCPNTSVRSGKADWYFENIGQDHEPMMISNVRSSYPKYYYNNYGLTFDKYTARVFHKRVSDFLN